jgi:hypothetical protein
LKFLISSRSILNSLVVAVFCSRCPYKRDMDASWRLSESENNGNQENDTRF